MNLELTILTQLDLVRGFAMPQRTLMAQVRLEATEPVKTADFEAALKSLRRSEEIAESGNNDTGTKWEIAGRGLARLEAAGI